eukprot:3663240-Amphidinium_carterae.1
MLIGPAGPHPMQHEHDELHLQLKAVHTLHERTKDNDNVIARQRLPIASLGFDPVRTVIVKEWFVFGLFRIPCDGLRLYMKSTYACLEPAAVQCLHSRYLCPLRAKDWATKVGSVASAIAAPVSMKL